MCLELGLAVLGRVRAEAVQSDRAVICCFRTVSFLVLLMLCMCTAAADVSNSSCVARRGSHWLSPFALVDTQILQFFCSWQ